MDSGGRATVGYGHLLVGNERELYANGISEEQALALLRQDINRNNSGMQYITTPQNQQQYDALSAFFYNLGVGALNGTRTLNLINGNPCTNCGTFEQEYGEFNHVDGRVDPGLTNRRNYELNLYNNGVYGNTGQINNMYNYMNRNGRLAR